MIGDRFNKFIDYLSNPDNAWEIERWGLRIIIIAALLGVVMFAGILIGLNNE